MDHSAFFTPYGSPDQGYVVLVARAPSTNSVVFIRKARPIWQKGLLNYPGGKIEAGESPVTAAVREFHEECGVLLPVDGLRPFARLYRENVFNLYAFAVEDDATALAATMTDEMVQHLPVEALALLSPQVAVENVRWMYDLAFDGSPKIADICYS